jgi:hypothetical protein
MYFHRERLREKNDTSTGARRDREDEKTAAGAILSSNSESTSAKLF